MTEPVTSPIYATFRKRFYAYGYDSLLVTILTVLAGALLGGAAHAQSADMQQLQQTVQALVAAGLLPPGTDTNSLLANSTGSLFDWSDLLPMLIVSAIYNILFLVSFWQATPGKRFCGIHVIAEGGGKLTLLQSALRHVASGISMLPLGLGYLTICFTREKVAPHDLLCGTRVVMGKAGI